MAQDRTMISKMKAKICCPQSVQSTSLPSSPPCTELVKLIQSDTFVQALSSMSETLRIWWHTQHQWSMDCLKESDLCTCWLCPYSNHMTYSKRADTLIRHTTMCRNLINFLYSSSHVTLWCVEVGPVTNAREGSMQERDDLGWALSSMSETLRIWWHCTQHQWSMDCLKESHLLHLLLDASRPSDWVIQSLPSHL